MNREVGLGTKLRHLTALLDGAVQRLYDEAAPSFRPRFFPIVQRLKEGPASIGDLASSVGVSQPAVTQTVSEMKNAGLIEVNRGRDGRVRMVALSDAGRRQVECLGPLWASISGAADELDGELGGGLVRLIDTAISSLERRPFEARIAAASRRMEQV